MLDERLDIVADVTRALIQNRGRLSPDLRQRFVEAGFSEEQLLEVVLGIAQKTITNHANHLFRPPLDEMFEPARWSPPRDRQDKVRRPYRGRGEAPGAFE